MGTMQSLQYHPLTCICNDEKMEAQEINCASDNPDVWWGGMERREYIIIDEKKPFVVDETKLDSTNFENHTGLVFVMKNSNPIRADLYISGTRSCTVMTFDKGKRFEYSKNGKIKEEFWYVTELTQCFKRYLPSPQQKESLDMEYDWCNKTPFLSAMKVTAFIVVFASLFAYYYRPTDCSWIVPVIILLLYVIPKILYYTNKRKEYWMICLIITSTLGFYITNYSTYWNSLLGSIFRFILQHEGEEVRDAYYAKQEYYYVIIVSAIQFLLGL